MSTRPHHHHLDLEQLQAAMDALVATHRLDPKTAREYARYWEAFATWCAATDRSSRPATGTTVAAFLAHYVPGRFADATVDVILAAIADRHRVAGLEPPARGDVRDVRRGIAREHPRPTTPPRALTAPLVEAAVTVPPPVSATGLRLRAALVAAHAAQVPVAQMARLDRSSLERRPGALVVALPAMKGSRPAPARTVELLATGGPLCPVTGLEAALAASSARHPLANPSLRERLAVAAELAGVRLRLDPFPAAPTTPDDLWRVWVRCSETHARFLRDRAYLLLVHGGALRAGEVLALRGEHLVETDGGLVVEVPGAPPDTFGRGQYVAIARAPDPRVCPVAAVAEWRRLARIGPGDVMFSALRRTGTPRPLVVRSAGAGVKRLTAGAGLGRSYTSTDARRGFFHSAHAAGESLLAISIAGRVKRLKTTEAIVAAVAPTTRRAPRALGL